MGGGLVVVAVRGVEFCQLATGLLPAESLPGVKNLEKISQYITIYATA